MIGAFKLNSIAKAVVSSEVDPYWLNVGLLISGEGTNGSTTLADSSSYAYSLAHWQASGATMLTNSTAQQKYGSGSMLVPAATTNSNGDMLVINKAATTITQPYARFGGVSNDWTVELFYRPNGVGGGKTRGILGYGFFAFNATLLNTGFIETAFSNTAAGTTTSSFTKTTSTSALTANTWYHLSWMRKDDVVYFYQDGVQKWTQAFTGTLRTFRTADSYDYGLAIGNQHCGGPPGAITTGQTADGYMDEVRITHYARYATSGFTPSTSAAPTTGGRGAIPVTASGNANTSTAVKKIGNSSAAFDGAGDFLQVARPSQSLINWTDYTNFTVEYWINPTSLTGIGYTNLSITYPILLGNLNSSGPTNYWCFGPTTDGAVKFYYYNGSSTLLSTTGVTLTTGTWYHLAMVKTGSTLKIYVDGVERASGTISGTPQWSTSVAFTIGTGRLNTTPYYFNGYLDEVRISKTARYSTGFTPSTTAFTNDSDTLMLLHMEGANGATTFTDDNS